MCVYRAGQVSSHGDLRQQLEFNLGFPLPAVLHILVAAQAVLTADTKASLRVKGQHTLPQLLLAMGLTQALNLLLLVM